MPPSGEVHTVIETPDFASDAKDAGMSREEIEAVVVHLGKNPQAGDRIEGTGGARKVRFAGRSKGKRGGYRVISYFRRR
jgi:mRNA-degrading endonuclease RelE of RelBE toxin-antitoxin system